jgi:uncharacterized protein HemX
MPYQLGAIDPNDIAPVLVCLFMVVALIVGMLVRHQQKMAMIMRGYDLNENAERNRSLALKLSGLHEAHPAMQANADVQLAQRMDALEGQVQELKSLMQQQTIMLDNVLHSPGKVEELRSRLGG